jgi:hypothetical protein
VSVAITTQASRGRYTYLKQTHIKLTVILLVLCAVAPKTNRELSFTCHERELSQEPGSMIPVSLNQCFSCLVPKREERDAMRIDRPPGEKRNL